MLVEVTDADIMWTEPRDVEISQARSMISSEHFSNGYFSYETCPRCNIAFADGSGHRMPGAALESDGLTDLLKIGGYQADAVDQKYGPSSRHIAWGNCLAFAVWLISTGWMFARAVRCRLAYRRAAGIVCHAVK